MESLRLFKGFDGKQFICHPQKELEHAIQYLNPSREQNIELNATINNDITTYKLKGSNRWCQTSSLTEGA